MCVCLWQCVCVWGGGGSVCVCSWQVGCCPVVQLACHFYSQLTKMMIILILLWFAFCRLTRGLCGMDMFYESWQCSQSWVSTVSQLFWGVSCTAVLSLFLACHVHCFQQYFTSFFVFIVSNSHTQNNSLIQDTFMGSDIYICSYSVFFWSFSLWSYMWCPRIQLLIKLVDTCSKAGFSEGAGTICVL